MHSRYRSEAYLRILSADHSCRQSFARTPDSTWAHWGKFGCRRAGSARAWATGRRADCRRTCCIRAHMAAAVVVDSTVLAVKPERAAYGRKTAAGLEASR